MANQLAELFSSFNFDPDTITKTALEGVNLFKVSEHRERSPMVYSPGIYIVVQGEKIGFLGKESYVYDENHYLVNVVSIPFECETRGSEETPAMGISIEINLDTLYSLTEKIQHKTGNFYYNHKVVNRAMGRAYLEPEMKDAIYRLVKCLQSEVDAYILGPAIVNEIIFRALQGQQAALLLSLAQSSNEFSKIKNTINYMEQNYSEKIEVNTLASIAGMSPSTFFKSFKSVTTESPIQYLKKIRLNKAHYLVERGEKSYIAAYKVGYLSQSQFSREFKKYFGYNATEI